MIRRIVLENYMAHVKTVIEPAAGLTVLTGPNNCGKSAIVHALEMICYNSDAADYAIRHGAKKAIVTLELDDDDGTPHTITWWRKEKTAGYVIDGREISGLGRGKIPDDLHRHLRMPMIESAAGEKQFLLHFGLQKAPIFLVDAPPSRAAQFFASATDADKLIQMQKAHQQKTTFARRDQAKLDEELEQLDKQLEALGPLPALSRDLARLESDHGELVELAAAVELIARAVRDMGDGARRAVVNSSYALALSLLEQPPPLYDTHKLTDCINSTLCSQRDVARNQALGNALQPLGLPPQFELTAGLRQSCGDIGELLHRLNWERERAAAMATLGLPPAPHDVPLIATAIRNVGAAAERCAELASRNVALAALVPPPKLADTLPAADLLKELERSAATLQRYEAKRDALKSLDAAPGLLCTDELRQQIEEAVRASQSCEHVIAQTSALATLAAPPPAADLQPLADCIAKIEEETATAAKRRKALSRLERQMEEFRLDLDRWIQANPRCDACGQNLSVELITQGVHVHA